MLFKVVPNQSIFETNPEMEVIEAFMKCTERDMKYICLVYDYKSPLRQMPIIQRKEKAIIDAGYGMEKDMKRPNRRAREITGGKRRVVQEAIKEFLSIQHDDDKELALAVATQIHQFQVFLKQPDKTAVELEKAIKIIEKLPQIKKNQRELEEVLRLREEEELGNNRILSTIDKDDQ